MKRNLMILGWLQIVLGSAGGATLTEATITEFVASNQDGIRDEDGDRSDWIEIWNSSGVGGDLGGWYLTDDPVLLTKWAMPAVELGSGEYLVVFASGKDRSAVPGEVHTNFRLGAAAGGYLALVKPDGVTIASEFHHYPAQFDDIAYGTGFETASPVTLVETGANANWLVPTGPVPNWNQPGFNDSSWSSGVTGIGFDLAGDYLPYIGAGDDLRSAMFSKNATVYIRIPFNVTDPSGMSDLVLSARWEDGFVAYLNGTEIHREVAPGDLAWNSTSNLGVSRSPETLVIEFSDYPLASGNLVAGANVLAIQGLNNAAANSDFLFSPRLTATQQDLTNLIPGFFIEPTPGTANSLRYDGITADTKFSMNRGFYEAAFDLTISSETADAIIRYTTDGSMPTEATGTVYTGPININSTTVVRAIAFRTGYRPTNVDTHTYLFPADVITQPAMRTQITQDPTYGPQMGDALSSIPSIALTFQGTDVPANRTEIPVSVEMINFESGSKQVDAGVARYGSYVTNFEKKSIRLHFRSEYGPKRLNYPLFDGQEYQTIQPVSDFDALDIRAGNHDMVARGAYLSNRFTDDTLLDMGQVAPHGRFVHLYFNGQYRGQYHLRERWDAAMMASYLPGKEEEFDTINANNTGSEFLTGALQDGDLTEWNQLQGLLGGANPYSRTKDLIDVNNLIDFMLLWTSGNAESEFRAGGSVSNGVGFKFMIKDADGHLRPPGGRAVTHNGPLNAMTRYRNEGDPDFKILLADQIHKHFFNDGAMTTPRLVGRLQKRVDEARLSYIAEVARWGVHNGNQVNRTPVQWEAYQNNLLNNELPSLNASQMAKFRAAGMYPNLLAPVLSQHGGLLPLNGGVTMTTNTTSIYYTVDGSDPRISGGAISPMAIQAPFSDDPREPEDFVQSGAVWKYLDDGSNQGTAWRTVAYDDTSWQSGPAQLGYGENDLATTIQFIDVDPVASGIQRNATSYFRKEVVIPQPSDFSSFLMRIRYDDGVAVYVNGVEVARTPNLPANADYQTYATGNTPSETLFYDFPVASSRFVDGANVIAVEVHNASPGSNDIRFDFELRGLIDLSNGNNMTEVIGFSGPTLLNARSFDSETSEWSALTSAFFSPNTVPADASNLVISEIHYRPADPTEASELAISSDRDDYEFIELLNVGSQPIDLTGVSFDLGISFSFEENTILGAGSRIVLVKNLEAFTARYGELTEGTVAGEYSGRLSNDGEQLILSGLGSSPIVNLTYNDQVPWPVEADGLGYSMIFIGFDQTMGSDWAANALIGGAPGAVDQALVSGYAAWKVANGILDDDSDGDQDGLTAFAEYAMGTDPAVANRGAATLGGLVTFDSDGYLSITYQQNLNASDVSFQVEASADLEGWTAVSGLQFVSEEIDEVGQTRTVTERLGEPVSAQSRRFLRVRMTR